MTRGYHLLSLASNRLRLACDWLLDAALPRQAVQFGLVRCDAVPLDGARPVARQIRRGVPSPKRRHSTPGWLDTEAQAGAFQVIGEVHSRRTCWNLFDFFVLVYGS